MRLVQTETRAGSLPPTPPGSSRLCSRYPPACPVNAMLDEPARPAQGIWEGRPSDEIVASWTTCAIREWKSWVCDWFLLSDKISLVQGRDADAHTPSFALTSPGQDIHLRFAGLPMGHEFTSLVLALLQVGGHPSKTAQDVIEQIIGLDGDYRFETYFSLSCQNCPDVVQALNLMAVLNPRVQHVAIDGALFPEEVEARQVMSVPTITSTASLRQADGRGGDRRQSRHRRCPA